MSLECGGQRGRFVRSDQRCQVRLSDLVWLRVTEGYTEVHEPSSCKMDQNQGHSVTQVSLLLLSKVTISLKCWTFKLLSPSLSVIVVLAATFTFVHIIEPHLDIQDNKHKVSVERMY